MHLVDSSLLAVVLVVVVLFVAAALEPVVVVVLGHPQCLLDYRNVSGYCIGPACSAVEKLMQFDYLLLRVHFAQIATSSLS